MKSPTSPATQGIVLGLILIVLAMISYFFKLDENKSFQYISYILFLGGIILCIVLHGKEINYQSTFGNYFGHGFKVSATVTALMVLYLLVLIFAFPDFKEKAIEISRKAMEENKNMRAEDIQTALEWTRKLFVPILLGTTVLGYLFFGAIASLLGAAFTKKSPVRPIDDFNTIN